MNSQKIINIEEIWVPCAKEEGLAVKGGKYYKLVARIANNVPIYLEDGVFLENIPKTKEEVEHLITESKRA